MALLRDCDDGYEEGEKTKETHQEEKRKTKGRGKRRKIEKVGEKEDE